MHCVLETLDATDFIAHCGNNLSFGHVIVLLQKVTRPMVMVLRCKVRGVWQIELTALA